MTGRLISLGQVVMDIVLYVDALPPSGGDIYARDSMLTTGGAFNAMAAARRDGTAVVYAGGHGTGAFGDGARAAMISEGIAFAPNVTSNRDTGFSVAFVEPSTERSFVSAAGAEYEATIGDFDWVMPTAADIVLLSGYSLADAAKAAAIDEWLARIPNETRIALDPGPLFTTLLPHVRDRVLDRIDIWTSNLAEAREFTGAARDEDAASAVASMLGPDVTTLCRIGAAGCVLVRSGKSDLLPGFPVDAVDSNGAGDAHTGVFLSGIIAGRSWHEAAMRANAAAAIAVSRYGPATSPRTAEIDELMARHSAM